MARRNKTLDTLIGLVVVVGIIGVGVQKFFEHVGFVVPVAIAAGALALYWLRRHLARRAEIRAVQAREAELLADRRAETAREEAYAFAKTQAAEARERRLLAKYVDPELVRKLVLKQTWVGQTSEQLVDSVGRPEDVDQKVLKTKKKEVWKYGHKGGGRYAYRITLDNDVVVGWDEKA
jgi:hypothetical protein